MATWHKAVCSKRDTGAPHGQAFMVDKSLTISSFMFSMGEGGRTSGAERPQSIIAEEGDKGVQHLLPPSQRWQYFHSVERSNWIPKLSGDFPFWVTHPKAFPPRCSLKAQP